VTHVHHKTRINPDHRTVLPEFVGHSAGFASQVLVDGSHGAKHMRALWNHMTAGGSIDAHVHSYEESFFVLAGEPVLVVDGRPTQLRRGSTGVIPIGREHSWRTVDNAVWFETASPLPRDEHVSTDTYFVGDRHEVSPIVPIDVRDPRNKNLFQWEPEQNDTEKLKQGAEVNANAASSSMSTAVYAYTGIAVKILVNERLDAETHTLLLVEFNQTAVLQPHDHPFEELYFVQDGETTITVDDTTYDLSPGDVVWTSVGTIHSFDNVSRNKVRFLEPQAPQPPRQYAYRFAREWEYLESTLHGDRNAEVAGGSIH
jgi:quercetin dioxygenase-like cupin family protein